MSEGQPTPHIPGARPVVLVTGLSGAGKASILRVLEDLGFETVDNPPLKVLEELVEDGDEPIAAGIDTRTRGFDRRPRRWSPWPGCAAAPTSRSTLVYATAEDGVLLRRYTETRRRHPLAPGGLARQPGGRRHRPREGSCSPRCGMRPTWWWTPPTCRCPACAA